MKMLNAKCSAIMETKKCEICGEIKPQSEFSKSYRNRCRACVAEQTRKTRYLNGHHVTSVIMNEPKIDLATADLATVEIRLIESAIAALIQKNDGRIMNYECEEIGAKAALIAHSAMNHMKFGNNNQ